MVGENVVDPPLTVLKVEAVLAVGVFFWGERLQQLKAWAWKQTERDNDEDLIIAHDVHNSVYLSVILGYKVITKSSWCKHSISNLLCKYHFGKLPPKWNCSTQHNTLSLSLVSSHLQIKKYLDLPNLPKESTFTFSPVVVLLETHKAYTCVIFRCEHCVLMVTYVMVWQRKAMKNICD